jgi:hypothetical protein
MSVLDQLTDPKVLDAEADFLALLPSPAPIVAVALRLAAAWLREGKSIDEVNAIVARYSAEAQELADTWPTAGA